MDLGNLLLRPFEIRQQIALATPQAEASSDELRPGALEHSNVVVEVAPAVEQALHRNRSREIVFQNLPRDRPVKMIVALAACGLRCGTQMAIDQLEFAGSWFPRNNFRNLPTAASSPRIIRVAAPVSFKYQSDGNPS